MLKSQTVAVETAKNLGVDFFLPHPVHCVSEISRPFTFVMSLSDVIRFCQYFCRK